MVFNLKFLDRVGAGGGGRGHTEERWDIGISPRIEKTMMAESESTNTTQRWRRDVDKLAIINNCHQ